MTLLNLFKPSPQTVASTVSCELSINGALGANRVKEILINLGVDIPIELMSTIYLEMLFFEIHVIDKLASNFYGSQFRAKFVNTLIDNSKANFMNTLTFANLYSDSGSFFEQYFQDAFYSYQSQIPIIAPNGEMDTIKNFVDRILIRCNKIEPSVKVVMSVMIYEMIESFLQELLSLKSIKKLMK